MKIFKLLTAMIMLFSSLSSSAQTNDSEDNNSLKGKQIYAEVGGPGVIFSANFDSRFKQGSGLGLGYRVGLGFGVANDYGSYSSYSTNYDGEIHYTYYSGKEISYLTIPLGINYVFGKNNSPHTFEVGLGTTILTKKVDLYNYNSNTYDPGYFIGNATFMYRKKPIDGGFTWRIGFMPVLGTGGEIGFGGAVGIGYAF